MKSAVFGAVNNHSLFSPSHIQGFLFSISAKVWKSCCLRKKMYSHGNKYLSLVSIWSATVCDTIADRSAQEAIKTGLLVCATSHTYGNICPDVCGTRPGWSGKLNLVLLCRPLRRFRLRNVCLRWSVSYWWHTIFRLETRPINFKVSAHLPPVFSYYMSFWDGH